MSFQQPESYIQHYLSCTLRFIHLLVLMAQQRGIDCSIKIIEEHSESEYLWSVRSIPPTSSGCIVWRHSRMGSVSFGITFATFFFPAMSICAAACVANKWWAWWPSRTPKTLLAESFLLKLLERMTSSQEQLQNWLVVFPKCSIQAIVGFECREHVNLDVKPRCYSKGKKCQVWIE